MQHRGRAVVFENFDMYKARINDPELDVDAELDPGHEKLRAPRVTRAWPRSATWACRPSCWPRV